MGCVSKEDTSTCNLQKSIWKQPKNQKGARQTKTSIASEHQN